MLKQLDDSLNNPSSTRQLPQPLGLSRVLSYDIIFDHYLSEDERLQRTLACCEWIKAKLMLFVPLGPMQQVSLKQAMAAIDRRDAIGAERAIVELISGEEGLSRYHDKFGNVEG